MGVKVMRSRVAGYVNISCWASGAYPEPRLTLYHGHNQDEMYVHHLFFYVMLLVKKKQVGFVN